MLWSKLPLLKLLFSLTTGILLADHSFERLGNIAWSILLSAFSLGFLIMLLLRSRLLKSLCLHLLFLIIGYGLTSIQLHKDRGLSVKGTENAFVLEIKDVLSSSSYHQRYLAVLKHIREGDEWQSADATILLKEPISDQECYLPNELIIVEGRISKVPKTVNPEQFDYSAYLSRLHVYHQIKAYSSEKLSSPFSFKRAGFELKLRLIDGFQNSSLSDKNLSILMAILLGDKSDLDTQLRSDFSRAGVMHVLAVSGLHLGIVFLLFDQLLRLLSLKKRSWLRVIVLSLVLWGFAFLTGMSNSVMRSALMFTILICSDLLKRKGVGLNSVAASALILLMLDPLRIFQVGFQLSYSAVFGILLIYPPLSQLFKSRIKLISKLIDLILISIAAQISTLPLTLAYFHQFPNLFLISNLLIIPLAFLIVGGGVLTSLIYLFTAKMIRLDEVLDLLLSLLSWVVEYISFHDWAATSGIWFQKTSIFLVVCVLIVLIAYLHLRKSRFLLTSTILILLIVFIENLELIHQSSQSKLTVYSSRPVNILSIKEGLRAVIIQLDSTTKYQDQMAIDHLNAMQVPRQNIRKVKLLKYDHALIRYNEDNFLIMEDYHPIDEIALSNHLIIRGGKAKFVQQPTMVKMIRYAYEDELLSPRNHNLRDSIFQITYQSVHTAR